MNNTNLVGLATAVRDLQLVMRDDLARQAELSAAVAACKAAQANVGRAVTDVVGRLKDLAATGGAATDRESAIARSRVNRAAIADIGFIPAVESPSP